MDMKRPRLAICSILLLIESAAMAASPKPNKELIETNTRLQIFLDNGNFGPGKIDGRQGEFTKKALAAFRRSKDQADSTRPDPKSPINTEGLDLSAIEPVFTKYTVTADDVASVGELPSSPEAQAKTKRLPYATVAEAVAEKFHCDLDFLKELNPKLKG